MSAPLPGPGFPAWLPALADTNVTLMARAYGHPPPADQPVAASAAIRRLAGVVLAAVGSAPDA